MGERLTPPPWPLQHFCLAEARGEELEPAFNFTWSLLSLSDRLINSVRLREGSASTFHSMDDRRDSRQLLDSVEVHLRMRTCVSLIAGLDGGMCVQMLPAITVTCLTFPLAGVQFLPNA